MITVVTLLSSAFSGRAEVFGSVMAIVPHTVEGFAEELHLCGHLQRLYVHPSLHQPPLLLIPPHTPLIDLICPPLVQGTEEGEDWNLGKAVGSVPCDTCKASGQQHLVVMILSSLQLSPHSGTVLSVT